MLGLTSDLSKSSRALIGNRHEGAARFFSVSGANADGLSECIEIIHIEVDCRPA